MDTSQGHKAQREAQQNSAQQPVRKPRTAYFQGLSSSTLFFEGTLEELVVASPNKTIMNINVDGAIGSRIYKGHIPESCIGAKIAVYEETRAGRRKIWFMDKTSGKTYEGKY